MADTKLYITDLIEINTALLNAIGSNQELLKKYKSDLPLVDRMIAIVEGQFGYNKKPVVDFDITETY